jgi:hypothetical protein
MHLRAFNLDRKSGRYTTKLSRLELYLRNTFGTGQMREWLQGIDINGNFYCSNGQICLKPNTPLQLLPGSFPNFYRLSVGYPFDRQPECEPIITRLANAAYCNIPVEQLVNDELACQTPFLLSRLCSLAQPLPVIQTEALQKLDHPDTPFHQRILLYDEITVNYLSHHFGITDHMVEDKDYNGIWQRSYIDMSAQYDSQAELIPFYTPDEVLACCYELFHLGGQQLLVPVGFYRHPNFIKSLRLYMPDKPPFHLYKAEHITPNPGATIVFTDALATAMSNPHTGEFICVSFPEGDDAIKHLELSQLAGRHVIWLLMDKPDMEKPADKYATALKVAAELSDRNVHLEFAEFTEFEWRFNERTHLFYGQHQGVRTMKMTELINKALVQGIYIPEELRTVNIGSIEGDVLEKMKKKPLMIDPVIRDGSGTVIYGATASQKSWLAVSIGIAAAHGQSVFPDRWQVMHPDGIKCLTIAGEMDSGEYGERSKRLNEFYAIDDAHKKNFILHMAEQFDLASEEGLTKLHAIANDAEKNRGVPGQPVSLVILDNLTTLSVEGENPANFGKIEMALKSLKARGIAVILIHHENQKGDLRGARKIGDVMDKILHVYKIKKDDSLNIIIKDEKVRSEKESKFATFKATLDVDARGTGWVVSEPTEEELVIIGELDEKDIDDKSSRKIPKTKYNLKAWAWMTDEERIASVKKQVLEGLTNAQIAVNHNTSRTVVCDFRKVHRIRNCDLREQGFNLDEDE